MGRRALAALAFLTLSDCGGNLPVDGAQGEPRLRTTTTPTMTRPALPTAYEVEPAPRCGRDATKPARRALISPPAPGLRAQAVTERTIRLEWSFRELSADCRPVSLVVAVDNGSDPAAAAFVQRVQVRGPAGTVEIAYPSSLPAPNTATARAYASTGAASRRAAVLISR